MGIENPPHSLHPSPKPPQMPVATRTSSGRKRPERLPGMTSSSAAPLVSDFIRKKFAEGWHEHVSLEYLTDSYCAFGNRKATKHLRDSFSITGTGTLTANSEPLPSDRESSLSFDEWYQAWQRLLPLIQEFLPQDLEAWTTHFDTIMAKSNRAERWETWLAYDIMVRTQSTQIGLDPAEFQHEIWNSLEAHIMQKQVLEQTLLRLGLPTPSSSSQPFTYNQRRYEDPSASRPGYTPQNRARDSPYSRDTGSFANRPRNERDSFRAVPAITSPSEPSQSRRLRCFICASDDPSHASRHCKETSLVSGRDCHIKRAPSAGTNDTRRFDRDGNSYCYSWNGKNGCDSRPDSCRFGRHWCSLCGTKSHNAQRCPSV